MDMRLNKTASHVLDNTDWRLIQAIATGIPHTTEPFHAIAAMTGIEKHEVINRISKLRQAGIIKRFGIVVRHHEAGYRANAMVVWNIPDDHVHEFSGQLIAEKSVHLCYRRPRRLPVWPYNLFCMVHGKERQSVLQEVRRLAGLYRHGLPEYDVLFSKRRFKQRGMIYSPQYAATTDDTAGEQACG